jgi:hypothetical protein
MIRLVTIAAGAALITGCGTTAPREPIVRTIEVLVPVTVPCVPDTLAAAPTYSDTDEALRAAEDAAARFVLLVTGRDERTARLGELEAAVSACRDVRNEP